ncbi:LptA/OstA family protein [Sandaracinobacteroides sp. A072]|uniref:LptA/OstA family protein n=1 Tax=Sandaracinobacteroides sp. A072 TaxID=3461146 RepID=UPI0040418287
MTISSMKPLAAIVLAALPVAAAPIAPLVAQGITTSALRGLDSKAPIDVDADRIDVLDKENQAIFTGNVRVRQGTLSLEANRIRVAYTRPASGDPVIQRLDADGKVRLATPSERATARFGIYDVDQRVLTLIGSVELSQGTTRVTGNRLTIDLSTGRSTMDGRTSTGQPGSRVTGRFAVPERKN